MADAFSIRGALGELGIVYRASKSGTGGANTTAQQIAVIPGVPAPGVGIAWELQLWVNCATDNAYSGGHYVGARARVGGTLFTNTRYNFTTSATMLPLTTVVVDSAAGTITISLAAASVSDGAVSYGVRYEFRTLSAAPLDITTLPTIA